MSDSELAVVYFGVPIVILGIGFLFLILRREQPSEPIISKKDEIKMNEKNPTKKDSEKEFEQEIRARLKDIVKIRNAENKAQQLVLDKEVEKYRSAKNNDDFSGKFTATNDFIKITDGGVKVPVNYIQSILITDRGSEPKSEEDPYEKLCLYDKSPLQLMFQVFYDCPIINDICKKYGISIESRKTFSLFRDYRLEKRKPIINKGLAKIVIELDSSTKHTIECYRTEVNALFKQLTDAWEYGVSS